MKKNLHLIELVWSGLLFLLAAVGIFWLVPEQIKIPSWLRNPYLSPRFWPTIIFYLIGGLGIFMFLKSVVFSRKKETVDDTSQENDAEQRKNIRQTLLVFICLACMGLCLFLIERLGMPLSVTLCVAVLVWLSGKKVPILGLLCLLALPYLLYLFFFHVADVSIPWEFLNNRRVYARLTFLSRWHVV